MLKKCESTQKILHFILSRDSVWRSIAPNYKMKKDYTTGKKKPPVPSLKKHINARPTVYKYTAWEINGVRRSSPRDLGCAPPASLWVRGGPCEWKEMWTLQGSPPTQQAWGVHVSFYLLPFTLFTWNRLNTIWMIYLIVLSFFMWCFLFLSYFLSKIVLFFV